ncbi:MAG TPA: hypothetical protein VK830_01105, partial [Xanthomonadales bacterium]|nr:hypothetical protein [Xanthomonadales bacterium]
MTEPRRRLVLLGCLLTATAVLADTDPDALVPFEGWLELDTRDQQTSVEVIEDRYAVAADPRWRLDQLPAFRVAFVANGPEILPLQTGPLPSDHPYWELLPGPGRAWREAGEDGRFQAQISFALRERYQNCTHNGLLRFAYTADGRITPVQWQVTTETCLYLKINLSGELAASFEPGRPEGADARVAARRTLLAHRLPLRPISALAAAHSGFESSALVPPNAENVS